jgi:hypothetical protein
MTINTALLRASLRAWYANDLRPVGPPWLQVLWTFLFSSVVGVGFFVLGVATSAMGSGRLPGPETALRWLAGNLLVSWVIGACIHLLFTAIVSLMGAERIRGFSRRQQSAFFAGVPLLGLMVGWPLGAWVASEAVLQRRWVSIHNSEGVLGMLMLMAMVSLLFYKHFSSKARQIDAERRATEAQLRLLQGQIEPHFLFNTLANVHALVDIEPARAKAMLGAFTEYLRASLSDLRRDQAPLDDEIALAEAYLRVQQTRMDDRLRFSTDVAEETRRLLLPPLLLQPLVENAVVHGLEPQVNGGHIWVRAQLTADHLVIEVQDNGKGLPSDVSDAAPVAGAASSPVQSAHPGGRASRRGAGLALKNLRERLASQYGDQARLELLPAQSGTLARLTLPCNPA